MYRLEKGAVLVCAGLLVWLVMLHPAIGVADNGDFLRIMRTVGLDYLQADESFEDKYFRFFHLQYAFHQMGLGGYISTQLIVVGAATLVGHIFSSVFDIRLLGSFYIALFLAGMYLLLRYSGLKQPAVRLVAALLFVFVFADVGYAAYYNSLFGEPVTFVFALLTGGFAFVLAAAERPSRWLLAGFFVCAVMLAGSKLQNAPVGFAIALLGFRLVQLREDRSWRRATFIGSALLVLLSAATYFAAPKELRVINQYQTVFYGIVKDSPDPQQDLRELGIDPSLASLAGTDYFTPRSGMQPDDPQMKTLFYDKISHAKVALFYAKHPARFLQKLDRAAESGMYNRPMYLGNYAKSAGHEPGAVTHTFGWWSKFKLKLPHSFAAVFLFFAAYVLTAVVLRLRSADRRGKLLAELFLVLALVGAIAMMVPLIGDGEADLSKHLFLYEVCFDAMVVSAVVFVFNRIVAFFGLGRSSRSTAAYRWR